MKFYSQFTRHAHTRTHTHNCCCCRACVFTIYQTCTLVVVADVLFVCLFHELFPSHPIHLPFLRTSRNQDTLSDQPPDSKTSLQPNCRISPTTMFMIKVLTSVFLESFSSILHEEKLSCVMHFFFRKLIDAMTSLAGETNSVIIKMSALDSSAFPEHPTSRTEGIFSNVRTLIPVESKRK